MDIDIDYGHFYKLKNKTISKCKSIDDLYYTFNINNRRIKRTKVNEYLVSTVFLVINHNIIDDNKPLLFETMVFPDCEIQERYGTYDEALIGHAEIVNYLKQKGIK